MTSVFRLAIHVKIKTSFLQVFNYNFIIYTYDVTNRTLNTNSKYPRCLFHAQRFKWLTVWTTLSNDDQSH